MALTVIAGNGAGLTAALNVTLFIAAPVLVCVMVPPKTPSAGSAAMRAITVVDATVPPVGVKVSVVML